MLEAFTKAVDRAWKCFKAIPGSDLFLIIDHTLLRRGLLLLIMMGVPSALYDFTEFPCGRSDIPVMWMGKQTVLARIQCSEVRKAARDVLIFLTYTVRQRLNVSEGTDFVMGRLIQDGEIPENTSQEQFVAVLEALKDWMDDRVRSFVATWVAENGIEGLFSSRTGPSPIDVKQETIRVIIKSNLLTASRMLLRRRSPNPRMGNKLGQIEAWEELGLSRETELWNECQALIRSS